MFRGASQLMVAPVKGTPPTGHHIHDFAADCERNINDRLDSLNQCDCLNLDESCNFSLERQVAKLFLQAFGRLVGSLCALGHWDRTHDHLASALDSCLTG